VKHQSLLFSASALLLIVLDLLTIATRAALSNITPARLLGQREQKEKQVNRTLTILNDLPQLQASLNFAQLLWRFLLAGTVLFIFIFWNKTTHPLLFSIGILLISALILFLSEWGVETRAAHNPERLALHLTPFARGMITLLSPLLWLPLKFSRRAYPPPESTVTQDDLMTLVNTGQQEGVFEQGESQMIHSIFRLGDTLAREIMVPRIDLFALEVNTPLLQAEEALLKSGHSRVPVYRETVDDIVGLLYAKDLLRTPGESDAPTSLPEILRPAYFIPEAKKADELLAELQTQRIHMAIVVDEYGGVAGMVTLEDIVEEIVGEILDEYDQAEELPYQIIGENEYLFQGRVPLDDFNEVLASSLPTDEADTLAGFIYSSIGRIPTGGETLQIAGLELKVEQVSGRRIRKVRARKVEDPPSLSEGPEI
jgi:CBS domain containing-hemolysin-like protein